MFHWKTQEVVEALYQIPNVSDILQVGSGGDYDTTNLVIKIGDSGRLFVTGFHSPEETVKDPDNTQCPYIEIKDGYDSRGGLVTDDGPTHDVYRLVRSWFSSRGALVIDRYDEIF